jgi:acylphosphatase
LSFTASVSNIKHKMSDPMENARVHLMIEGRVQGVFFRASAREEADRLGLKGWVRNCADGSVEAALEGERVRLEVFASWCHHGPPGARVARVRIEWVEYRGEFQDFRIRR